MAGNVEMDGRMNAVGSEQRSGKEREGRRKSEGPDDSGPVQTNPDMSHGEEDTKTVARKECAVPAEVDVFLKENKRERVYLSEPEISSLETKLREGRETVDKSSKIYNAFRKSFPTSELCRKYETIRNLLEKQSEYFSHGTYFLKTRSVDNFIDQIKSLTVDMSYDLKSSAMEGEDINHGEYLRNAVKVFIEKKKKSDGIFLNTADVNEA